MQARDWQAGEQLCSDGAQGLGTQQAEHEPAAGLGNTTGQQHLRLLVGAQPGDQGK